MSAPLHRRSLFRLATGLLLVPVPLQALAAAARVAVGLEPDGIPVFERHETDSETEAPAVRFVDWHPLRAEMLVLARHGVSQQLHRLAAPGEPPQPLTRGRDAVKTARWAPAQGRYLVFSRDHGGNEAFRLYRLDDAGGDALPLTPEGERVAEFEFLPEGRGLVYLQEQLNREAARTRAAEEGDEAESRAATGAALSRLWWTDPAQPGERRLLAEQRGGRYTALRVSPAGRVLATLTQGGRSRTLRFALDGSGAQALDAGPAGAGAEADTLYRRQALQGDFRHLLRLDAASGRVDHDLTAVPADLEALAEPPPGSDRPLALVYNEAGLSVLRLYAPGGELGAPVAGLVPGLLRNPRWHPRLPLLGFDQVSADSPGRVFVLDASRGALQAWTAPASGGPALRAGLLRWQSFDGLEISGLHLAPPAHFAGPRPVYISIHGGPSSQARPGYVAGVTRTLVERFGMHVIQPNVRGSDGFGKRFLNLDNGRLRENAVRDISALLDLIAQRPDMDASRVVVAGGSYGGYMSLAVAVHESARIAGSICRVGIANFVSFLEHTEGYRRDNRRAEYGDERDPAMREFLERISPLNRADAVKKPLFIVHGRNDPRVPYREAQAMAAAVRAQGTPVWLLSAADEGHSFSKADNRAYLTQATLEFVKRVTEGRPLDEGLPAGRP